MPEEQVQESKKRVWVNRNHKRNPVGYVRRDETPKITDSIPIESIEVWLYHPDVMSKIGEYVLWEGEVWKITKLGLEPYSQA